MKTIFNKFLFYKKQKSNLCARNPNGPDWGEMRRLQPVSRHFGFDRGKPIDRYYIELFLHRNSIDISGDVLEISDAYYTVKFGGNKVTCSHVLHAVTGNPNATIVGNLSTGEGIPHEKFNCAVLTQTLPFIFDVRAAIVNVYKALKKDGILLATFPGISQISRYDMELWGDYWRFTDASARLLFGEVFGLDNTVIETYGNVLAACAFMHGLASHELTYEELDYNDADYQLMITVRAIKTFQKG